MPSLEAEEINFADPFSDRKHGPRTRSRAYKENTQSPVGHKKRARGRDFSPDSDSHPTYASFAQLEPAEFPSLDPRHTVEQIQAIKQERELQRCAVRDYNPFEEGLETYSTSDPEEIEDAQYSDLIEPPQQPQENSPGSDQIGGPVSHDTTDSIAQSPVVEDSVQYYKRAGEDPYLYKTFLTKSPLDGKVVRWHQRASRAISRGTSDDGHLNFRDSSQLLAVPQLDPDTGSASPRENTPVSPIDLSQNYSVGHQFPDLPIDSSSKNRDMAENVAPAVSDDATRGMPYYDRLKKTLKTSIKQKQELEDTLAKIEQSIWNKEAAYLDETVAGNIMKGFDNYIKAAGAPGSSLTGGGTASRKKATVSEQDRLFSKSSVGFWNSMREGSPHASAHSTPSHAPTPKGLSDHPTPTSTTSMKGPGFKKKKNTEKDEESDGKQPNKRLKITFSRTDKD